MGERAPLEPLGLDAIRERLNADVFGENNDARALLAHIEAQDARIEYLENDKSADAASSALEESG